MATLVGERKQEGEFGSMNMVLVAPVDSTRKDLGDIQSKDRAASKAMGHKCTQLPPLAWCSAIGDRHYDTSEEMDDNIDKRLFLVDPFTGVTFRCLASCGVSPQYGIWVRSCSQITFLRTRLRYVHWWVLRLRLHLFFSVCCR